MDDMMNITECNKNNLCVDCDDRKCSHYGDKVADCPKYPQTCTIRLLIDSCDDCTWIDKYVEARRSFMEDLWKKRMKVNDVVQFNENHKWCGVLGIVREIKGKRIMVGVPMPQQGTAFIFCSEEEIELIGPAKLVFNDEDDEE